MPIRCWPRSGTHGEEGSAGSLHIEGPIQADGSAELHARGRTNNPDYAVNKPSRGSAYTYRIKAQFDDKTGKGSRGGASMQLRVQKAVTRRD